MVHSDRSYKFFLFNSFLQGDVLSVPKVPQTARINFVLSPAPLSSLSLSPSFPDLFVSLQSTLSFLWSYFRYSCFLQFCPPTLYANEQTIRLLLEVRAGDIGCEDSSLLCRFHPTNPRDPHINSINIWESRWGFISCFILSLWHPLNTGSGSELAFISFIFNWIIKKQNFKALRNECFFSSC